MRRRFVLILLSFFIANLICLQFYLIFKQADDSLIQAQMRLFYSRNSVTPKSDPKTSLNIALPEVCKPFNTRLHPLCTEKFNVLKVVWGSRCFKEVHKLNGTDCSILHYLQNIEPFCPKFIPQSTSFSGNYATNNKKLSMRTNLDGLLAMLQHKDFKWMRDRISHLWKFWLDAVETVKYYSSFLNGKPKKILIFPGAMSYQRWLMHGTSGVMGELVQWSDVITCIYLLGHDVTIVLESNKIETVLQKDEKGCASTSFNTSLDYDLIFTDIVGNQVLRDKLIGSSNLARYQCKMRLLDSFGTEAEYNYAGYAGNLPGGKSPWGNLNLQLPQFYTYFPHSPDNTFLGFAGGNGKSNVTLKKKNQAVLYGKVLNYLKGQDEFLNIVKDYFEIHATMGGKADWKPSYVKNHGILDLKSLLQLLAESKVFIGLGFPYEGPGPLDAIAQGAVFINPKYSNPKNKINDGFFDGKPTLRKVTSQNPYMEDFVNEPHSYTVNTNDTEKLRSVLKKIKESKQSTPYLPREFTYEGMLEKVHTLLQNQNFCDENAPRWPPVEKLFMFLAQPGKSCKDECHRRGLICEQTFFHDINHAANIQKYGVHCNETILVKELHPPSYNTTNKQCYIQDHYLHFSCVSEVENIRRLCPCRTFIPGQTAICEGCL